jgi:hypothetical protein
MNRCVKKLKDAFICLAVDDIDPPAQTFQLEIQPLPGSITVVPEKYFDIFDKPLKLSGVNSFPVKFPRQGRHETSHGFTSFESAI